VPFDGKDSGLPVVFTLLDNTLLLPHNENENENENETHYLLIIYKVN